MIHRPSVFAQSALLSLVLSGCGGSTADVTATGTGGVGAGGSVGSGGAVGSLGCESTAGVPLLGSCRVAVTSSEPKPKPGPVPPGFSITGPVIETGPAGAGGCNGVFTSEGAFEFVLEGEGGQWKFFVYVPGFQNPLEKGKVINVVSTSSSVVVLAPANPFLTVRDENGALLFHITEGREPNDLLMPKGFALDLGDALCSGTDDCGAWTHHSLVVSTDGQSTVVPFLGSSTLSGHRLVHGGAELPTSTTSCHGGYVGLALIRLALD